MGPRQEEVEIELMEMLRVLFRRFWAIFLAAVLLGGCFCAGTVLLIQPKYTAETLLYINNRPISVEELRESIRQSDLTAIQGLTETCHVILRSRSTLEEVSRRSGVGLPYQTLLRMVSSENVGDTEVLRVSVTSPDPQEAELLANTIAEVLPEQIVALEEGGSARVISYAEVPTEQSSPSVWLNTLLGCLLGGFFTGAFFVSQELRDDRLRDAEEIAQHCGYPVLAVIPELDGRKTGARRSGWRRNQDGGATACPGPEDGKHLGDRLEAAPAEAYKRLRANLAFCRPEQNACYRFGLTSAERGEGKTTTAINTAYTCAQEGRRVLLIEADLRLPNMARRLGLGRGPGLSDVLAGRCSGQDALRECGLIGGMWVLPGGDPPPDPAELLDSGAMEGLLEELSGEFDTILVDLPPVGIVADALVVSRYLDGLVVVVRRELCGGKDLDDVFRKLELVDARVLGIAVTGSDAAEKKEAYRLW